MPTFGKRSLDNLAQAHPDLQKVMHEAIKHFDFSVICGYRGMADQNKAYASGASKARFGQSPHNFKPSLAVDCTPYPLDWKDEKAFKEMGKVIMDAAMRLGVRIRWGGDWDFNEKTNDGWDKPHFELHPWKDYKGKK